MATLTENCSTWTASSQHTLCFSLWDSWLKEFGVASDFKELQLSIDFAHKSLTQRVEDTKQEFRSGRLDRKYPGKLPAFAAATKTLASIGRAGAWGLGQYIQSWRLYTQVRRITVHGWDSCVDRVGTHGGTGGLASLTFFELHSSSTSSGSRAHWTSAELQRCSEFKRVH